MDECFKNGSLVNFTPSKLRYFCGHHLKCNLDQDYALSQAIDNVNKNYVVVGLLEHLNETFDVLDYNLPRYFRGARKSFEKMQDKKAAHAHTATWRKAESPESKAYLKSHLVHDDKFYAFLKTRLFNQYDLAKKHLKN